MESKLQHHVLKAVSELEANLAETIVSQLLERLAAVDLAQGREELLTDKQICSHLQISLSHFYNLKKKHKSTFPHYSVHGAMRYKISEVESFFKVNPQSK